MALESWRTLASTPTHTGSDADFVTVSSMDQDFPEIAGVHSGFGERDRWKSAASLAKQL